MDPDSSLLCSPEPATRLCPEPVEYGTPHPLHPPPDFPNVHFNVVRLHRPTHSCLRVSYDLRRDLFGSSRPCTLSASVVQLVLGEISGAQGRPLTSATEQHVTEWAAGQGVSVIVLYEETSFCNSTQIIKSLLMCSCYSASPLYRWFLFVPPHARTCAKCVTA
jgi:hypothetical protein